ncbi:MAG: AraC family transcriptional regulator [Clostridia bacterium]|nr:AraC family transcriptional regulator [Clostridia bacterium]
MQEAINETMPMVDGITPKILCEVQSKIGTASLCEPHYHTYIEMLYVIEGTFTAWLDSGHHAIGAGDFVVVCSNEVHTMHSAGKGRNSYIVLRFDPAIIYGSASSAFDAKYVMPFLLSNKGLKKLFRHSELYGTEIPQLFGEIIKERQNGEYGSELAVKIDVCRIYLWLLRFWHGSGAEVQSHNVSEAGHLKSIQLVLEYISEHFCEDISAADMASAANMSYSYFSRIFKSVMNKSFNEYLNIVRITEAERLLISSDMSITDISAAAGFASSSYFIKIFEKHKGISPGRYRKSFSNAEIE